METLEAIGLDPCHSACDRLLVYFRNRPDITFISVTHTIDSGFVTMKKDKRRETDVLSQINSSNTGGIDTQDIMNWRNTLKVDDGKKILVALAWMHDEDKRSLKMFPEMLGADVTFGICKEQRNLFRIVGINGDFKAYEAMNCFMPSKQYRAYEWAINHAFPQLISSDVLRLNSLIASDQEPALVASIRTFIDNDNQVSSVSTSNVYRPTNSKHRLDMFHIFTKEWKSKVSTIQ
jgi:hypothetical protein